MELAQPMHENKYVSINIFAWDVNISEAKIIDKWSSPKNDDIIRIFNDAKDNKQEVILFFCCKPTGSLPVLTGLAKMLSTDLYPPHKWPRASMSYSQKNCFEISWIVKNIRMPFKNINKDGSVIDVGTARTMLEKVNNTCFYPCIENIVKNYYKPHIDERGQKRINDYFKTSPKKKVCVHNVKNK